MIDDTWQEVLACLENKQTLHFSYEDYEIVGDTEEISRIIQSYGRVNVSVEDIAHTLSKKAVNYVSVGEAHGQGGLVAAIRNAVGKLPVALDTVSKLLFYVWMAEDSAYQIADWTDLSNYLGEVFPAVDACWGMACDEALHRWQVKIVLIAAGC